MKIHINSSGIFFILIGTILSCNQKQNQPAKKDISDINLKKGPVVLCGPPEKELGTVRFAVSGNENVKKEFNLATALLHSFEYEESEKVYARVIELDPSCAMAWWGVAMSNFHPLWNPPEELELKKGLKALEIARSIKNKTARESDYIEALNSYFQEAEKVDHLTRCIRYEKAMEGIYKKYPGDKEAAIFYALALDASANRNDKTFANQKKAGEILNGIYPNEPDHPGIVHYLIHTYDSPELAQLGSAGRQEICFTGSSFCSCPAYAFSYFYTVRIVG